MKTPIETIRLILTNHFVNPNYSHRKIARMVSVTHKTVIKIRKLLEESDLDNLEILKTLSDSELKKKLGISKPRIKHSIDAQLFEYMRDELKKRDMTVRLLHAEFKAENPNCVSYSQFARKYKQWLKTQKISMRQTYKAGEQVLVDFCGKTMPIYDIDSSKPRYVQVFVGVLGASGYIFAYAVDSQKVEDWLICHIEMFRFFGGVPEQVVTDNLKSAVITNNKERLEINRSYASLAEYFDFAINPTRPRKPQDKGLAEVGVQVVQRGILAKLRHRKFFSLGELNEAIHEELKEINHKTTTRYKVSRYEQFLKFDKPALAPLPINDYVVKRFLYERRVSEFYLVDVEGVDYSVPYQYAHKLIDVAIGKKLVEFFYQRERIACHHIAKGGSPAVIEIQHMPKEHQLQYENNPDYLKHWAKSFGQSTYGWMNARLTDKRHFARNLRALDSLKSWIAENEAEEKLELACQFALACNYSSCTDLRSIITSQTYLRYGKEDTPISPNHVEHENLRGRSYYQKMMTEQLEKNNA